MALKIVNNEKYGTKELNLRDAEPGDKVVFELLYPEPVVGTGKFGEWQKYTVRLIEPEQHDKVSFFARGGTMIPGRKLGEYLKAYGVGTIVTANYKVIKGAKGYFGIWDCKHEGGEKKGDSASNTPTTRSPPSSASPKTFEEQVVDVLVKRSEGSKKDEAWLRTNLNTAGLTEEDAIKRVLVAYNLRW